MRIDKVYIKEFKNLTDFKIDIDKREKHTVLLGQNAAGKSNFLEALVIIFRDLDLKEESPFNYEIEYQCKDNLLKVVGGPGTKGKFQFYHGVQKSLAEIAYDKKPISKKKIEQNRDEYLPKYVFSYYSGISNRLLEHFDRHQNKFYKDLLDGIDEPFRPLFYARHIHSYFVLLAFYGFNDNKINTFLKEYLNIVGLESVLFVMKKPNWRGNKKEGDSRFWYAKGVVKDFLTELWDASIGPIYHKEKIREDFNKHPEQEELYLYISNQEKLEKIAKKYRRNTEFFKKLESTYMSDLIQEVRVKVKKQHVDGNITFKELSEGEQQLLTVIGLLRFTKAEESLILLDEPDTHLNPLWKWKYMNLLHDYTDKDESSQIIMTTHDPLVIGGLSKEEIRVFYSKSEISEDGKEKQTIKTMEPYFDPKGLGVAGILTSEFFNLPTSMDEESFKDLTRKRELEVLNRDSELSPETEAELQVLTNKLSRIGFDKTQRDPLYDKFIHAVYQNPDLKRPSNNLEERKIQNDKMAVLIKQLMDEEKKP
ncbi:AAA family ATPase [Mucilaginibacter terrae]|uniref:ABC-type multidrug transport system ATPase subunit n=1 Tax=Mucilaginibacter terrae TaxID=1955052 RepID=A0ABU3GX76_9SPHI|nr:AAA family ATPase [Mucilaginibacter terrae]MDT3404260.1 ABC-type multidrug transport system ATPase subunit [Mucilaginibacter terrae]